MYAVIDEGVSPSVIVLRTTDAEEAHDTADRYALTVGRSCAVYKLALSSRAPVNIRQSQRRDDGGDR